MSEQNQADVGTETLTSNRDEIRALFNPSLESIGKLMKDQIERAQRKPDVKVTVWIPHHLSWICTLTMKQKVILMGGFGQSTSVHSYLQEVLKNDDAYQGITLVCPMLM